MEAIVTKPISEEETARLQHVLDEQGRLLIRTMPGNVILPASYQKYKDGYKNWEVRPDDVYVCTFAKNGTTWTQELVWLLQNNCNFKGAKSESIETRFPHMEMAIFADIVKDHVPEVMDGFMELDMMAKMPSPRMFKSHLRFCLLPDDLFDTSKVVICLRNPKDTVVSYYHFERLFRFHGYTCEFATYFDLFMDGFVHYGSYFEYVKEAWAMRNHPNVCLLFFEDMKKDLASNVRKVAKFLGKELTDENVEAMVDHLSFKKMKDNAAVNKEEGKAIRLFNESGSFMRKGEVGDWKNFFTDEMNKRMDEATEKHLKPIGLEFRYE